MSNMIQALDNSEKDYTYCRYQYCIPGIRTSFNGKVIDNTICNPCIIDMKKDLKNFEIKLVGFDEIWNYLSKPSKYYFTYNLYKKKSGARIIELYGNSTNRTIKSKTTLIDTLKIQVFQRFTTPSMEQLYKCDAILVQKFLKERDGYSIRIIKDFSERIKDYD